jgi:hypothetical protein
MEAVCSSEMFVLAHNTTCHNPKDYSLNSHCCEKLKFYVICNAELQEFIVTFILCVLKQV